MRSELDDRLDRRYKAKSKERVAFDAMGMETVAEYVETPEICMRLIELQVQFGQGYAIGRPRPLDGILDQPADLAHAS